jgi:uncharacterized protein
MQSDSIIEIRRTKFGKGVFATGHIPKGTILFSVDPGWKRLHFRDTTKLGDRESHALQIGIDEYILLEPPVLCVNHSCNPNCGFNDQLQLVTIKNIFPAEELFWDYSTSMFEQSWVMKCSCGSSLCRNEVKDFDSLPHELQQKYLKMNIVLSFIVDILKQRHAKRA